MCTSVCCMLVGVVDIQVPLEQEEEEEEEEKQKQGEGCKVLPPGWVGLHMSQVLVVLVVVVAVRVQAQGNHTPDQNTVPGRQAESRLAAAAKGQSGGTQPQSVVVHMRP